MIIQDELLINAPVDAVWQLTTDVEGWPQLSPTTIKRVERLEAPDRPLHVGSQARIKQPAQRATVWTVTSYEPNSTFVWETAIYGIHTVASHTLSDVNGSCRNLLRIEMTGRGSKLLGRLIGGRVRHTIATENRCFKTKAEAAAASV